MAAPPEIETPSSKGIHHSIIPTYIPLINANYVCGARELRNNKQRQLGFDSFLQSFIHHPVFNRSTVGARNATLV